MVYSPNVWHAYILVVSYSIMSICGARYGVRDRKEEVGSTTVARARL